MSPIDEAFDVRRPRAAAATHQAALLRHHRGVAQKPSRSAPATRFARIEREQYLLAL